MRHRIDMFRFPKPQRVLVLAPHPDDEAVGCGGYLSLLADRGAEITVAFVTDGAPARNCESVGAAAQCRLCESETAARLLNVTRTVRWHLPDGGVSAELLPTEQLETLIAEHRIEVVLSPHPGEAHPDHAEVARWVARLGSAYQQLTVMSYEIWTPLTPNCAVNITGHMDRKLRAIRAYASQCEQYNLDALASGLAGYRAAWSRMRGWGYAECFAKHTIRQLQDELRAN